MNPYITKVLATEKIRDMQADAAAARRARQAGSGRKPASAGETGRLRALLSRRPAHPAAA
jgi:hypothetical protein